jgi:uncharacterized damage-inducible protein DinB
MGASKSAATARVELDELLRHNQEETEHWRKFFAATPAALDVPMDMADMKTVRGAVVHIFVVEQLYGERLSGISRERLSYDDFPAESLDQLFSYHELALAHLRKLLDSYTEAQWREPIEFKARVLRITASRRKMFLHVFLHSMRHWAQVAMVLRQAGFQQDWQHDFIFTQVME